MLNLSGSGVGKGEDCGTVQAEGSKSKGKGIGKVWFHQSPASVASPELSIGSTPFIFKIVMNRSINYRWFNMANGRK